MKSRAPVNGAIVRRVTRGNPHGIRKMASGVQKAVVTALEGANSARQGPSRAPMPAGLPTHEYFFLEHELDPETYPLDHSWMAQEKLWFDREHQKDNLVVLPTEKTSTYLDGNGKKKFDDRYEMVVQRKPPGENHPKILAAQENETSNAALLLFHLYLDPTARIPIAGNPSEPAFLARRITPALEERQIDPEWFQGAADVDEADFVRLCESVRDSGSASWRRSPGPSGR